MKKCMYIVLALVFTATLFTGCGKAVRPENDMGKISVVATIFPPYDFTRAIAGDNVDLTMLLPPASESHSYEPTPQDIIKIQSCDLFVYNGGDSDAWVDGVLASMDTDKMRIIKFIDCVEIVEEEIVEGMEDEEAEEPSDGGEEEPEYDEHVWTSPRNAKLIAQKISNALCQVDAANAEVYKSNTAIYLTQLDELDQKFKDVVASAARNTIVFGDRFPFRYFADAYGLEYFAAFPGCSTETEANAKTVAFLIDKIKTEKIPVVFHIELGNENMANSIAEQTGAKVLLFHASHNITKADFEAGKTYLDIMSVNVDNLKEALN